MRCWRSGSPRVYLLRPGFIQPVKGVRSKTAWYQAFYTAVAPLSPLIRLLLPGLATTTSALGRALIQLGLTGLSRADRDDARHQSPGCAETLGPDGVLPSATRQAAGQWGRFVAARRCCLCVVASRPATAVGAAGRIGPGRPDRARTRLERGVLSQGRRVHREAPRRRVHGDLRRRPDRGDKATELALVAALRSAGASRPFRTNSPCSVYRDTAVVWFTLRLVGIKRGAAIGNGACAIPTSGSCATGGGNACRPRARG